MKKLEDFMRSHRDEFDSELPSPQLWEKIESGLAKSAPRKRSALWKISAAIAAVLVLAFVANFLLKPEQLRMQKYAGISDPELINLLETEAYYSKKVSLQLKEINKCYNIYPELKMDIESDLNELDNMYRELENDLNDNLYNREVIEAMIQNNRLRLELVDRVLDQINC